MKTSYHLDMVRAVLSDRMSPESLAWVLEGNQRTDDVYPEASDRHFDNCADLAALEKRWENGLNHYFNRAVELARPERIRRNRKWALWWFGYATHTLQDFYAHTNWVEIYAARGEYETLAPLLEGTFRSDAFPVGITSGFYSLRYGDIGCPCREGAWKPPQPYQFCHEQIAKDHPDKKHGAETAAPDGRTFYQLAISLATRATEDIWKVYQDRLTAAYGSADLIRVLAWGE
jgi:hypothetical protein